MSSGWIGVDLDGTLAHYEGWKGPQHIGPPVKPMLDRVLAWLKQGKTVRIFTARVTRTVPATEFVPPLEGNEPTVEQRIQMWCMAHLGEILTVTCIKDYGMIELWDDRAVQVEPNTGRPIGQSTRGLQ